MPAFRRKSIQQPTNSTAAAPPPCISWRVTRRDGLMVFCVESRSNTWVMTTHVSARPTTSVAAPSRRRGPRACTLIRIACETRRLISRSVPSVQPPGNGNQPPSSATPHRKYWLTTVQMPLFSWASVPAKTRTIDRKSSATVRRSEPNSARTCCTGFRSWLLMPAPHLERLRDAGERGPLRRHRRRRPVHLEEHRELGAQRDHAEDRALLAGDLDQPRIGVHELHRRRRAAEALFAQRLEARLRAPAVDVGREPAALAAHDREGDQRPVGPEFEDLRPFGLRILAPLGRTLELEHRANLVELGIGRPL